MDNLSLRVLAPLYPTYLTSVSTEQRTHSARSPPILTPPIINDIGMEGEILLDRYC
jgi:hypothetical protein